MFSDITVLIAEDNASDLGTIGQVARSMGFKVITCAEVTQGLQQLEHADILMLDLVLANGMATPLLNMWRAKNRGPVCVLSPEPLKRESSQIRSIAWNSLVKPLEVAELRAVLQRYGEYVLLLNRCMAIEIQFGNFKKEMEKKFARQMKIIWALLVVIVLILGGKEAAKILLPLI